MGTSKNPRPARLELPILRVYQLFRRRSSYPLPVFRISVYVADTMPRGKQPTATTDLNGSTGSSARGNDFFRLGGAAGRPAVRRPALLRKYRV